MIEYEQFDRAVSALDAVVSQTSGMIAGYEDGLVAGMMPPGCLESESQSLGHSSLRRIPRKPYTKNLDANN